MCSAAAKMPKISLSQASRYGEPSTVDGAGTMWGRKRQVAAPDASQPPANGGEELRRLTTTLSRLPEAEATKLAAGLCVLNVATFEESYGQVVGSRHGVLPREASVKHCLLKNLFGRNYLGVLGAHALICLHMWRGWEWLPASREDFTQAGEMAAAFLVHSHYRLNPDQIEHERQVLARGRQDDRPALLMLATDGQWDAARAVMMAGMQVLSRNLLAAWRSPEAHEQLVYQQWMLALRTNNSIGALLLHELAMAHHTRGWDWRPSPDEFDLTAEAAARLLIDRRYGAAAIKGAAE
jgi:hypothetical protein